MKKFSDLRSKKISESAEENINESGHTDVASMKQKVKVATMAIQKMNQELSKLPDDGDLPTWWTNKVAIAVDNLDGMSDYLDTKVESVNEAELTEAFNIDIDATVKMKTDGGKYIYGKVIKQIKVNGKPGVTVQWKSGTKGNFKMDQFANALMDRKADYEVQV